MTKQLFYSISLILCVVGSVLAQTPLSKNGRLKLVGNQLSNECGFPVQLRGMSTHGPQWFQNCYNESSVKSLAQNWGADIIRLAMYTEPAGAYISNPSKWDAWIDQMVTLAEQNGMYVIIDWHILKDYDPHTYKSQAKTFFQNMSQKYKNKKHVLYEICNEPNRKDDNSPFVSWSRIKSYAEEIIPIIRANDKEAIIIVGTPEWSGKPGNVISNKLSGSNAYNVMYTFHFYSGTHNWSGRFNEIKSAAASIPIFVTEWGTVNADGGGAVDQTNSDKWINIMNGDNNGGQKMSWCNWSFADKDEGSAALKPGSCSGKSWTNTTTSGTYVRGKMNTPDNFQTCTSQSDSDGDGVTDVSDNCPNTPSGATVNASGCPDTDKDGVFDDKDLCPNTANGEDVDADGCALTGPSSDFNAAIDDFNTISMVKFESTGYGINWWIANDAKSTYEMTRTIDGMKLQLTNASPTYKVFGLNFGVGKYINLDDFKNADIKLNITNNSDQDIYVVVQLKDINGNKAEIFIENEFNITWDNQWEKIGAEFPKGKTTNATIDLSEDRNQLGGFEAGAYTCSQPTNCPVTSYEIDVTKITELIFIVNGGAGTTDDPSRSPASGELVFNYFSIGETVDSKSKIIKNSVIGLSDEIDNNLSIFPQPSSDNITIRQKEFSYQNAALYSLTGALMKSVQLSSKEAQIALDDLNKGTYILQLQGADKAQQVRIVVR